MICKKNKKCQVFVDFSVINEFADIRPFLIFLNK